MKAFGYLRATSTSEAIDALVADADAVFHGGGTNLVDLMRLGVATPGTVVDISGLGTEISAIDGGGLRVGAGVRNSDLAVDLRISSSGRCAPAVVRENPGASAGVQETDGVVPRGRSGPVCAGRGILPGCAPVDPDPSMVP